MGIMRGLRKTRRSAEHFEVPVATRLPDTPPQLMLLLPDAGGIATYALNQFPSAKAAEFFLDSTLRGQLAEGAVLFWALTRKPIMGGVGGVEVEPLVIIRDVKRAIVYPFSFSEIDSAHDFIRHEMRRGLDLGQVMVYWAVPARIEIDFWGRSTIIPPAPPQRYEDNSQGDYEFAPSSSFAPIPEPTPINAVASGATNGTEYLADEDIAEAVKMINNITETPAANVPAAERVITLPVSESVIEGPAVERDEEAEVIDFPSATQKLFDARAARNGWHNFSLAIDEALDAYIGRLVITKLVWNRLVRALAEAATEAIYQDEQERLAAAAQADELRLEEERQAAIEAELEAEREEAERQANIRKSWKNIGVALFEGAGERGRQVAALAMGEVAMGLRDSFETAAAHRTAVNASVSRMTVAIGDAAHAAERQQGMRRAWLNAAWTLEEACYAHALEQKARAIHAWRNLSVAIVEGARAQQAHHAALRNAWCNAAVAMSEAVIAHFAHLQMLRDAWDHATYETAAAVELMFRIARQRTGNENFVAALGEAVTAYLYRESMIYSWATISGEIAVAARTSLARDRAIAAWANAVLAIDEVCQAYIRKQKLAIRAWRRLAIAFGEALEARVRQDAAIAAWTNITLTVNEFVAAKVRYDGAVAAWGNAGIVIAEAVEARFRYEGLVTAWTNAGAATREAVVARERHIFFCDAWAALTVAFHGAVSLMIARQVAMQHSWMRLTMAFSTAVEAKAFRDSAVAAWANAAAGINEMVGAFVIKRSMIDAWTNASAVLAEAVPAYFAREAAIAAWGNAGIAFKEAVVAEAKLRIAQAGLDKMAMAEVEKTVKAAQKAVKAARTTTPKASANGKRNKNGKTPIEEPQPATDDTTVSEPKLRHAAFVAAMPMPVAKATDGGDTEADGEVVTPDEVDEPITETPATEKENDADSRGGWRIHEGARWEPREEPFRGFQSPPGRFYRKEREEKAPGI